MNFFRHEVTETKDPEDDNRLIDLEALRPRLLQAVYTEIDRSFAPHCTADSISELVLAIAPLENLLAEDVAHQRKTEAHIDIINTRFLTLLALIQPYLTDMDQVLNHSRLERLFLSCRYDLSNAIERQQSLIQIYCALTTPDRDERCTYRTNLIMMIYVYGSLSLFCLSLVVLMINDGSNKTVRDVFSWTAIVSSYMALTPLVLLFTAYLLIQVCGPCIDHARRNQANSPEKIQTDRIIDLIYRLYQQQKPRQLEDFRQDPSLLPRNLREVALKCWFTYIGLTELLKLEELQAVLEDYDHYLKEKGQSLEEAVAGDFVDKLLNHRVDRGRTPLKSIIYSDEKCLAKVILTEAIAAVKEASSETKFCPDLTV